MALPVSFDHCVIHVSNWELSNAFYREVLGAELVRRPKGWAYRFGKVQLNLHGPGFKPAEVARLPVQPGNSDLCFEWTGPIGDAASEIFEPESLDAIINSYILHEVYSASRYNERIVSDTLRRPAYAHLYEQVPS